VKTALLVKTSSKYGKIGVGRSEKTSMGKVISVVVTVISEYVGTGLRGTASLDGLLGSGADSQIWEL